MPETQAISPLAESIACLPVAGQWRLSLPEGHVAQQADFVFSGAGVTAEVAAQMQQVRGVATAVFVPEVRAINLTVEREALYTEVAAVVEEGEWRPVDAAPVDEEVRFRMRYLHLRARGCSEAENVDEVIVKSILSALLLAVHLRTVKALLVVAERFFLWHEAVLFARAAEASQVASATAKKEAIQARGGCAILARTTAYLSGSALSAWRIEPL